MMNKSITMGYWNVEGLNLSTDSKLDNTDFINVIRQHHIFALAETHVGEEDHINIEGYNCVKICRPLNKKINRHFGG